MTIDEAIEHRNKLIIMLVQSEFDRKYDALYAKECKESTIKLMQEKAWLEELKDLRKWKELEEKACDKYYNKGVDDFVNKIINHLVKVENSIVEQRNNAKTIADSQTLIGMQMCIEDFLRSVEQLKAGRVDDRTRGNGIFENFSK